MRHPVMGFFLLAFSALAARAEDKTAAQTTRNTESLETVNREYDDAKKARAKEVEAAYELAKKDGKEKGFRFDNPHPNIVFSPRFLAIAAENPEGPEALDALEMTLRTSNIPATESALEIRGKAVKILRQYYATKPSIADFLKAVTWYTDGDSKALVADVIAHNPDRAVQFAAYIGQVRHCENVILLAEIYNDPKRREGVEKRRIDERIANAENAKIELEALKNRLRENYSDLYNELTIGSAAPEIKIQSLDGSEARLSSLKGKVVVLDFWATWCGWCIKMIPHEREMVERLEAKPFVLVSISVDEKKETLTDFLAKEKMPWTHWWNGGVGGVIDDWNVTAYPTIYVLDSKGVIRYKDLRGEELEKAVNLLLAEKPEETAGSKSK
jgi:thiol-disulfide isomerase/thioredoxin